LKPPETVTPGGRGAAFKRRACSESINQTNSVVEVEKLFLCVFSALQPKFLVKRCQCGRLPFRHSPLPPGAMTSSEQSQSSPLTFDQLQSYFSRWESPQASWRVGIEHEKIPTRPNGAPVPYAGPGGVCELLAKLKRPGLAAVEDDHNLIGLEGEARSISLEPGSQVELAAPPVHSVSDARVAVAHHIKALCEAGEPLGIRFIHGGFRPFGSIDDVSWLPKKRYDIMRAYLPTRGRLAHEMMKRTATMQANFDFADEADAHARMRTALGVTSIVTAMAASSPIAEGQPNGHKSYRAAVWNEMDEDRCGLLPFVFESGSLYKAYTEWALDIPMFFIERSGSYIPAHSHTFRRFWSEGLMGHRATLDDWKLHLSTVFPEVRLKHTIEVRGADSAPKDISLAVAALWRGLLDDVEARHEAWKLVEFATLDERETLRQEVPRGGLSARLGHLHVAELARQLCTLARDGLRRLANPEKEQVSADDRFLLEPLEALVSEGKCPADIMLDEFEAAGGNPEAVVKRWALCPKRDGHV